MRVRITWIRIEEGTKLLWTINRGLYAYLGPDGDILYIGKVNGSTVRKRFQLSAKPDLWNFIANDLGHAELEVIVGILELPEGARQSRQLLSDIESLLIHKIKPPGNIACRNTRIARPGLSIRCTGDWAYFRNAFFDSLT